MSVRDFDLTYSATNYLQGKGWTLDRSSAQWVDHTKSFKPFPEAERIIRQFGGLVFTEPNRGEVIYMSMPPGDNRNIVRAVNESMHLIEKDLFPFGYMEYSEVDILVVDAEGVVYIINLDESEPGWCSADVRPFAACFDDVLNYYITLPKERVNFERLAAGLKQLGLYRREWRAGPWKSENNG